MTPRMFRLSGILFDHDPLKQCRMSVARDDFYDGFAERLCNAGGDWEKGVFPIITEMHADKKLHDAIFIFLSLSTNDANAREDA